jgi:hypothetical protein
MAVNVNVGVIFYMLLNDINSRSVNAISGTNKYSLCVMWVATSCSSIVLSFVDATGMCYTASCIKLCLCGKPAVCIVCTITKTATTTFVYTVCLTFQTNLPACLITDFLMVLIGCKIGWTICLHYKITTYNSNSNTSTCETTVSSTSTGSSQPSKTNSTNTAIYLTWCIGLSGCQCLCVCTITITDTLGHKFTIDIYKVICKTGYGQSVTAKYNMTLC